LRLFERLFSEDQPDAGGRDFRDALNSNSRKVVRGFTEPSVAGAQADDRLQFERHGYFVADRVDHSTGRAVFNRVTGLKDGRGK
jgi:glutaminyl-tRNA synthetase